MSLVDHVFSGFLGFGEEEKEEVKVKDRKSVIASFIDDVAAETHQPIIDSIDDKLKDIPDDKFSEILEKIKEEIKAEIKDNGKNIFSSKSKEAKEENAFTTPTASSVSIGDVMKSLTEADKEKTA